MIPFRASLFAAAAAISGGGGSSSPYYTAEYLSGVASGAGPAEVLDFSLTADQQEADATYLGIWTADKVTTSITDCTTRLVKDGSTVLGTNIHTPQDLSPNDRHQVGGFFIHDAGSSPSSVSFTIDSGTATNTTVYNSRISLLKLGADDSYADSAGPFTNTTTTYTTAASHTFVPGSTGDYTVLVSFELECTGTTYAQFEVTDGTTSTGQLRIQDRNGSGPESIVVVLPLSAVSGSRTISVKHSVALAGQTITTRNVRIIALRNDRFANVYSTRLGSSSGGTDTSYTTVLSQTFTPSAGDHLVIASGLYNGSSTSLAIYGQFLDDATQVTERIQTVKQSGSGRACMMHGHCIATFSASSRTQAWQRKSESGSVTATALAGTAIVCFDLAGLT